MKMKEQTAEALVKLTSTVVKQVVGIEYQIGMALIILAARVRQ
jgi:hypothetical protein